MAKLRLSIDVLNIICDVLFINGQKKWRLYLPWVEYWYNTTYHISTGMTPFQALYGRLPPTIPSYNEGLSPVHEVDQQLQDRDELL
jgi:hypothetical protein